MNEIGIKNNHFHPTIYLVEKYKKVTQENIIISSSYLEFMYFALRDILKDKSYNQTVGYEIALSSHCPRQYTKSDLVISFDYINQNSEFDTFIDKTFYGYHKCPEVENINPKIFTIFDRYIKNYEIMMRQLVCSEEGQSIFATHNKVPEFINLVCEIFSLSDYNQESFFSEESLILAYETCLNISVLADNTICNF